MEFQDLEKRIRSDYENLSEFDREAVHTVSILLDQFRQATELVQSEGLFDEDGHRHFAVKTQLDMSSEITRWVKERPDLFGKKEQAAQQKPASKLERFKVV